MSQEPTELLVKRGGRKFILTAKSGPWEARLQAFSTLAEAQRARKYIQEHGKDTNSTPPEPGPDGN